jgi:hypothetical protein
MFIASTVNPKSASHTDLPVVVLTYGDQSCLVNVPKTYEDTTGLAIKVFSIDSSPASIVLTTSTLDICQGRTVRIFPGAWESIFNLVAEVEVSISDKPDDHAQKIARESLATPSPSKRPQAQVAHTQNGGGSGNVGVTDDQDVTEDEDEAEQLAALSSFAGSVANSEYGDGSQISEEEHPVAKNLEEADFPGRYERSLTAGRALPSELSERNQTDEEWVEYNEPPDAHPLEARPQQLAPALDEFRERDLQEVKDVVQSQADLQGAHRAIKKETLSVSRPKPEPSLEEEEVAGTSQPRSQSQEDDEPSRFIIDVEHRPSEQELRFKTRGEHTVGKVLSKACKRFKLDYDSATLKLIVEIDGEEGGEILSDCDPADSMARAGAMKGARFIIVTDDD